MSKARKATGTKTVAQPLEKFKLVGKGHSPVKPKAPLERFPLNKKPN